MKDTVGVRRDSGSDIARCLRKFAVTLTLVASVTLLSGAADAGQNSRFLQARMIVDAPSAAKMLCNYYEWACSKSGERHLLTQSDIELVRSVNRQVNRQIRAVADASKYQKADYWTLPKGRSGDCEDIALLKKKMLISGGIAPERLLMATVLDRRGRGHAVLILRSDSGDYVLDNLTSKIKPWQATGYTFLRMQSPDAPSQWVRLMVRG